MLTNTQQSIAQQLISAAEHDKKIYTQLEQSGELFSNKNSGNYHPAMRKVHEENAQLLETFIAIYGWPIPSVWGQEVHEAAWFIAIHAISKPALLKKSCTLIKQALDNGEKVAEQYARLFDRIALYEGRQQRYGTQFFPRADGTWYARDLEDPLHIEERRAKIGLISFAENQKEVDAWAATLPEPAKPVNEEQFLQFLKEVGWR